MAGQFVIETPMMWIDKAGIWAMAESLGVVDAVIELTHTCYRGDRRQLHAWGYGCAHCPACDLRAEGFRTWRAGH